LEFSVKLAKVAAEALPQERPERLMASLASAIVRKEIVPEDLHTIDRDMARAGWTVPGEVVASLRVVAHSLPSDDPDLHPVAS